MDYNTEHNRVIDYNKYLQCAAKSEEVVHRDDVAMRVPVWQLLGQRDHRTYCADLAAATAMLMHGMHV